MGTVVALRLGLRALGHNLMRTTLTMLGMIIGVAAVICIVALGAGARQAIEQRITSAGTNMIIVRAGNRTIGGVRLGMGASSRLREEDAAAIRAVPRVAYVSPGLRTRQQVISDGQNWSTSVEGAGADMPAIRNWQLEYGTFFTAQQVRDVAKVAVVGSLVRDAVFGTGANPVGRLMRIGMVPFRVIGVLVSKGDSSAGDDQDDTVFVPYTTVQKRLMGVTSLDRITIGARSADDVPLVVDAVTRVLRIRHDIQPGAPDDFRVMNLEEIARVRSESTATMTWLLICMAAVSLVVGGIGIMNIMLVSVTERTREIGIRAAIGARERDVLAQFLLEAALISAAGGVLGVLAGIGAARAITMLFDWPTHVPTGSIALAFACSAAVGLFFGFYPARKASRLDPIEALRFD